MLEKLDYLAPYEVKSRGSLRASIRSDWWTKVVWYNMDRESCCDTSKGPPLDKAMATSLPRHGKNTVSGLFRMFYELSDLPGGRRRRRPLNFVWSHVISYYNPAEMELVWTTWLFESCYSQTDRQTNASKNITSLAEVKTHGVWMQSSTWRRSE